jgi:hypothetical protein
MRCWVSLHWRRQSEGSIPCSAAPLIFDNGKSWRDASQKLAILCLRTTVESTVSIYRSQPTVPFALKVSHKIIESSKPLSP